MARIAIVGDRDPGYPTHRVTDAAFAALGADARWVATPGLAADVSVLDAFDGVLVAPGSPYQSMDGALSAIAHARRQGIPLFGT